MNVDIYVLGPDDTRSLRELIDVFQTVFEMETVQQPNDTHFKKLLNHDSFFAVVAKLDNRVIAGLSVYKLESYYSEKPLAYIYDLAVLKEFQRKGIGQKLIAFTKNYCRLNGFESVFVQAEQADDYAIDFYRHTNPTLELQAVHFSYSL